MLSIGQLVGLEDVRGLWIDKTGAELISNDEEVLLRADLKADGLYHVQFYLAKPGQPAAFAAEILPAQQPIKAKQARQLSAAEYQLAHERMGHAGQKAVADALANNVIEGLEETRPPSVIPKCVACLKAKDSRSIRRFDRHPPASEASASAPSRRSHGTVL